MPYYNAPRKVERYVQGSSRRAYPRFALPGIVLIIIGALCTILGCLDIAWTATRYGESCNEPSSLYFDPCEADGIYSWVASGIWGGILLIIGGMISLMMTPTRLRYDRGYIYYVFVGVALFLCILVTPAMIVLNAMGIVMNDGTFYNSDVQGQLVPVDATKFSVPIVLCIFSGLAMITTIIMALIGCFCRPQPYLDEEPVEYVKRAPPAREVIVVPEEPRREIVEYSRPPPPREVVEVVRARPQPQVIERVVERPRREPQVIERVYVDEPRRESRRESRRPEVVERIVERSSSTRGRDRDYYIDDDDYTEYDYDRGYDRY